METADKDEMDTVCLILLSVGGRGWPEVDEKVCVFVLSCSHFHVVLQPQQFLRDRRQNNDRCLYAVTEAIYVLVIAD